MTFEEMLPSLKRGGKYRRSSWYRSLLYIYCENLTIKMREKWWSYEEKTWKESAVTYYAFFAETDIFADDWEIVE